MRRVFLAGRRRRRRVFIAGRTRRRRVFFAGRGLFQARRLSTISRIDTY
jgi:hypothetical protein